MTPITHETGSNIPPVKIYSDKFSGSVVVVTGGAAGIGEVTARFFAQQGADVVIFDVDKQRLEDVQDSIRQGGGKAHVQVCDVSNEASVNEAIEGTIQVHSKIDVLVNIAGIYSFHPLVDYPTDVYRRIMSVNLDGSFYLTRAVLPHMQKAGYGRIIHTSSSTYGSPDPGLVPYTTSKAGIIGLVRASAVEAGPGITVNVVLPGLTDTVKAMASENSSALFDSVLAKQVIKRRGHPLDAAYTFGFVASPEASFFTGQIFQCSGGHSFN